MGTLLEVGLFLLGMGFTEVIVKPFAMMLFRRAFKLLPKMFDRLDPVMPESIASMSPEQLEKRIYDTINGVASEEGMKLSNTEKEQLFQEFLARYNPVTACSKTP